MTKGEAVARLAELAAERCFDSDLSVRAFVLTFIAEVRHRAKTAQQSAEDWEPEHLEYWREAVYELDHCGVIKG